jgi:nitrate reductase NapAB chaperone NapD
MIGKMLCLLLLGALLLPTVAQAQAIKGEDATEADGAKFQNERARQHMLELEQRMFRLAEMLKESQPEDAQRLIMGVERSREKLLVQRMDSVSDLIGGLELNDASTKIESVIGELQAIKKLLLTADLETAIKQEQLRKIKEAIKALEAIEAQEAENQGQSDKLAESGDPSKAAMKGVGDAEKRNQEATDRLKDKVGDINPQDGDLAEAQKALGEASGKMGEASGQLSEGGSPSGASESQGDARKKLSDAKKKLEAAKQKLQEELERKIRGLVVDNLRAMLKQQTQIREQLEIVSDQADSGDARAIVQVRSFAAPEQEIIVLAEETIELCELVEFSVALPPALSAVRDRMIYLVDDYSAGLGGPAVVNATKQVEKDLESLIDAMEMSNANQEPKEPKEGENPRDQEQREVNQILAELRMLRIMQVATNENVVRLERARKSGDLPQSVIRQREEAARDQQDLVRSATAELRKRAMQGG